MIKCSEFASDGSDICLADEPESEKFRGQSSARIRVRRDQADAVAARGIAGDAEHRRSLTGQTVDDRIEFSRVAGSKDNPVVLLLEPRFQCFGVSIPEPGILMKCEPHVEADGRGRGRANSFPQRIEEMRDLFGENDGYLNSPVQLQGLS